VSEPEISPEVVAEQVRRQAKAERDENVRDEIDQANRLAEELSKSPDERDGS
jgi:hypothetical protein